MADEGNDGVIEKVVVKKSADDKRLDRAKQDIQIEKAKMIQTTESDFFNPTVYGQFKIMANDFIAANAITADVKNAEQMIMKFQAGFEIGLKPIESLNSLYIVNGRVSLWGAALGRRLRVHGWKLTFTDEPNKCTAKVEKGDEVYEDTATFEEADKSGFTRGASGLKVGWREGSNRKLKLRYMVLNNIVKSYLPEVLGSTVGITEIEQDFTDDIAGEDAPSIRDRMINATAKRKEMAKDKFEPLPVDAIEVREPKDDEGVEVNADKGLFKE